jgi:hypothetical protein
MPVWNAHWIEDLHSPNAGSRSATAREVFAHGRTRAMDATRPWFEPAELRTLLCPGRSDHPEITVGLAVHPATFDKIRVANGSPRLADVPPDQDASEFELHFPGDISLDVLTTRDPGGPGAIARYLAKQGEGVQQVEFRCANVDLATNLLRAHFALDPVYPVKRAGANGTMINFFLVTAPDSKKVLIELYEPGSV